MHAANEIYTVDQALQAIGGWRDFPGWCKRTLTIRDKSGQAVPLQLTPSQLKFHHVLRELQRKGEPARIIVLKARQVHMSVGVSAALFHQVAFLPGQRAAVVADSHKSASQIWGYYDQFYESYQDESTAAARILPLQRRTTASTQSSGALYFEGGGFVQTFSADNTNIGRSFSLRFLHLSEYAFWRDPQGVMTGLLQTVPDDPGTVVVVESTANGVGNPFHQRWLGAVGKQDAWLTLFFAWWEHPEYRMQPPPNFQQTLTDEEHELANAHGLLLDQLYWRRWAIANKCEHSVDRFRQEYPATPAEAFVTSGRPRFLPKFLARQRLEDPAIEGTLERVQIGTSQRVVITPRERGELAVWARPVPGRRYVIGADTAEGIDNSGDVGSGDPDYSSAHVAEAQSGRIVARLRARLYPHVFGDMLAALGELYNWAFIVPEVNSIGLATLDQLIQCGYPLGQIYTRDRAPDDRRPPQRHELGWKTTTVTRPQLLGLLDRALAEGSIVIPDEITLGELSSFVVKASGKAEAAQGCHDDTVFSLALAVVGIQAQPIVPPLAIQGVSGPPRWRASNYGARPARREDD
jgi:hypothetical protein